MELFFEIPRLTLLLQQSRRCFRSTKFLMLIDPIYGRVADICLCRTLLVTGHLAQPR